jgi:hypothetical protein
LLHPVQQAFIDDGREHPPVHEREFVSVCGLSEHRCSSARRHPMPRLSLPRMRQGSTKIRRVVMGLPAALPSLVTLSKPTPRRKFGLTVVIQHPMRGCYLRSGPPRVRSVYSQTSASRPLHLGLCRRRARPVSVLPSFHPHACRTARALGAQAASTVRSAGRSEAAFGHCRVEIDDARST